MGTNKTPVGFGRTEGCFPTDRWPEPRIEFTEHSEEELTARYQEVIDLARQHAGEPVMVTTVRVENAFHGGPGDERHMNYQSRSIGIGIVNDNIEETDAFGGKKIELAKKQIRLSDYGIHSDHEYPLTFSTFDASEFFEHCRGANIINSETTVPCLEVVFGKKEIASWFNQHRKNDLTALVRMMNQLGQSPVETTEIKDSIARRQVRIIAELIKKSMENHDFAKISKRVEKLVGATAISFNDESGEIESRPKHPDFMSKIFAEGDTTAHMDRRAALLIQELIDLGMSREEYNETVVRMLGIDLPKK